MNALTSFTPFTPGPLASSTLNSAFSVKASVDDVSLSQLRWLGFVADGNSHPLSSVTACAGQNTAGWSLGQWQTIFPFVKALTAQIDRCAIQHIFDLSPAGAYLHLPVCYPQMDAPITTGGNQQVKVRGAGMLGTVFTALTPGADFWQHGVVAPANFTLEFDDFGVNVFPGAGFSQGDTSAAMGGAFANIVSGNAVPSLLWRGLRTVGFANVCKGKDITGSKSTLR